PGSASVHLVEPPARPDWRGRARILERAWTPRDSVRPAPLSNSKEAEPRAPRGTQAREDALEHSAAALPFGRHEVERLTARCLHEVAVANEVSDAEVGEPPLARAEHLPRPPEIEVDLREPEPRGFLRDRRETRACRF